MHSLAWLIGRSPRAVKRFANIYRILRASRTPSELLKFVGTDSAPGEYEFVLLLLAVVIGTPTVSTEVFEEIRKADPKEVVADFASRISPTPPKRNRDLFKEWDRACNAIGTMPRKHVVTIAELQAHVRYVSQYSFREPLA
jgi:hypothetical protein